jgi:general secretion pathway protein D
VSATDWKSGDDRRFARQAGLSKRRILPVACLAWCILFGAASIQAAAQDASAPPSVLLTGEVELARLVDLCAERLGLNIEYDAAVLKGSVTLRLGGAVTDSELWILTNRVLASRGFASVQRPGEELLSIVRLSDAPKHARLEEREARAEERALAGFETLIVRAEHRPVKEVAEAIRAILSQPGGSLTPIGEAGLMLLSDLRPRIDEAMRVLALVDVPVEAPVIETIPALHLQGSELAALVTEAAKARSEMVPYPLRGKVTPAPDGGVVVLIAPPHERDIWKELIARFDQRQSVETRSYAPRHFTVDEVSGLIDQVARDTSPRGSADQWRMVADQLTGTVIVTATPGEHERIGELISRLDAVPGGPRRGMRMLQIRNRPVEEMLDVVSQLTGPDALTDAEAAGDQSAADEGASLVSPASGQGQIDEVPGGRPGAAQDGITPPVAAGGGRSVMLTADEGSNTLIAIGESGVLEQIKQLIETLDVRQPQVMIDVMIVGLREEDTLDLGVELEKLEISGSTLIRLSSVFGLGSSLGDIAAPARGFSGVVLSPRDFSIVVRALQTANVGRSMNLPKTLVNNHEQATLDSIFQEPFTSTNASTTVATTSFGGFQDAGTQVSVTPQIAEGDHVVLEYSVTLSTFVGESVDPTLPPPRQQNTLQSKVTIPDGYTVVLGGLETTREDEAVSQVPILGDLPIIGEVFKSRSQSSSRTRFYVFICANVLRHEGFEDLKYLSDRESLAAGVDDGWPKVEPRVIR